MSQPKKPKVLFASNNPGKVTDAQVFAKDSSIQLLTPKDLGLDIDVDETGETYQANALLKAQGFQIAADDPSIIVIADDGGIEIPSLNNQPGVHSRRWNGTVMTDQEIIDYCLDQLKDKTGAQRDGIFISVICVLVPGKAPKYFRGEMRCYIVEQPVQTAIIEGFPFRSLMYIPELDKMIYDIHGTTIAERGGFMTHRERALQAAFDWIAEQSEL